MSRNLWAGALSINLPEHRFQDCSKIRALPDNQEVFLQQPDRPNQPAESLPSVIVELCEIPVDTKDATPSIFHFNEIAKANHSSNCLFSQTRELSKTDTAGLITRIEETGHQVSVYFVDGVQVLAENAQLRLLLAVIRLPHINTDILVSLNIPCTLSTPSSTPAEREEFIGLVDSLKIIDWSLFG